MMKLFRVNRNYLPSRSTWPDWFHAKKRCLSLGLKVDGRIINKQQTMLGKESEQITECVFESLRNCAVPILTVFLFLLYFTHFSEGTLYLLRLVRTSCAICFITVSIINLRTFELFIFVSILNETEQKISFPLRGGPVCWWTCREQGPPAC